MGAPKQRWTEEEEEALKKGVEKYGPGKWRCIQKDPRFGPDLTQRSNVDLKDKWRNMTLATSLLPPDVDKEAKEKMAGEGGEEIESDDESTHPGANRQTELHDMILGAILAVGVGEEGGASIDDIEAHISATHSNVPPNVRRILVNQLQLLAEDGRVTRLPFTSYCVNQTPPEPKAEIRQEVSWKIPPTHAPRTRAVRNRQNAAESQRQKSVGGKTPQCPLAILWSAAESADRTAAEAKAKAEEAEEEARVAEREADVAEREADLAEEAADVAAAEMAKQSPGASGEGRDAQLAWGRVEVGGQGDLAGGEAELANSAADVARTDPELLHPESHIVDLSDDVSDREEQDDAEVAHGNGDMADAGSLLGEEIVWPSDTADVAGGCADVARGWDEVARRTCGRNDEGFVEGHLGYLRGLLADMAGGEADMADGGSEVALKDDDVAEDVTTDRGDVEVESTETEIEIPLQDSGGQSQSPPKRRRLMRTRGGRIRSRRRGGQVMGVNLQE